MYLKTLLTNTLLSLVLALFMLNSQSAVAQSEFNFADFDFSVRAADDFYTYANGGWLNRTKIPADRSNYGTFTVLADKAELRLKQIIEESAAKLATGTVQEKMIGDMYRSFMNTLAVEQFGMEPVNRELNKIDAMQNMKDVSAYMGDPLIANAPVGYYIYIDSKNTDRYIVHFTQAGLGLPDRSYYLEDEKKDKYLDDYKKTLNKLARLGGLKGFNAEKMVEMETEIATAHWTRTENRNRDMTYNLYKMRKLPRGINWKSLAANAGFAGESEAIVRQPSFFKALPKIMKKYSVQDWANYFKAHLLIFAAPYLTPEFEETHFDFFSKKLRGIEEPRERWKRAVESIDEVLGEVVGQVYVEKYFPPEAKRRMVELVENLRTAYRQSINELDWLSEETKKKAIDKLEKFNPKIGYPDEWRDYSCLQIGDDTLLENLMSHYTCEHKRNVARLGAPIDKNEWFMTPQTVNAYYNPSLNEIVFPAAILQPPFFDLDADDSVNYGGIGAVIGHEMGHGFDDQGSKSNGDGKLENWWTDEDRAQFENRTSVLVDQYGMFEPLADKFVNGKLTLGENIGDLGGLTIALKAYKIALGNSAGREIGGLSPMQRFFLSWARVWQRKYRDSEMERRLSVDSHSPAQYRVNGVVVHMPEFYEAFNVGKNDAMFLPVNMRVKIW